MVGRIDVDGLDAWYGGQKALYEIRLAIPEVGVNAIIGPSGCGKTTFLRCLNRLHEETPGSRMVGSVRLDGQEIAAMPVTALRRRVGMVFQRPTPFSTMSIYENVAAGPRLAGTRDAPTLDRIVYESLAKTGLWEEVRDDVDAPGTSLSGGQQQRLCFARAIAVEPEVLLLDEPCAALDPVATAKVERLIIELGRRYTILLVTHNLAQARRLAQRTAFFYLGKVVEFGPTEAVFDHPKEALTENYVRGRFG